VPVDLNDWTGSLLIVALMGGLITGFSALLGAVAMRIGNDEPKASDMPHATRNGHKYRLRKAA
jgi:ABC-type branched-subunit amino acid transport system permease subunit